MATLIRRELDAAVAIVTLDKPPHNLIDGEFLDQYCVALETSVAEGARGEAEAERVACVSSFVPG